MSAHPVRNPAVDHARARQGASLIEAAVVVAILIVLGASTWAVLERAAADGRCARTRAILAKVDTALRQYRAEVGICPWQSRYPQGSALGDADPAWSNRLGYSLGHDLAPQDRARLGDELDQAAAACAAGAALLETAGGAAPRERASMRGAAATDGVMVADESISTRCAASAASTSAAGEHAEVGAQRALELRLLQGRARLLLLAGDLRATLAAIAADAPRALGADGPRGADLLVAAGASAPGWACNYLQDSLDRGQISGEQVLDAWGHALIYINQAVPLTLADGALPAAAPALATIGGQRARGRIRLDHRDAPDPLGGLPDPACLMHSDITTYAAPGYEAEFELWSAGPDGRFDAMRDGAGNQDNIGAERYDQDLDR